MNDDELNGEGEAPKSGPSQEQGQSLPGNDAAARDDLADLRRKAAEYDALMDRLKRVTADFMNSQKRLEREMHERAQYALEGFARELLPVADNLERALAAGREGGPLERILEGVERVEKQLRDIFARHGIRPIEPSPGEAFNAGVHEAISAVESDEHAPDKVVQQAQKGYTIHKRLLRPAQVVVSKKPQKSG
jgi:molecular chaperone GrpE